MSHRPAQIESTLQRTIADILQRRISDPRLEEGVVSITRVQVSPDMRDARVFVSVMPAQHESKAIRALQDARGHIQRLVFKAVAMRNVPRLDFRLDTSLKKQADVHGALNRAAERTDLSPEAVEQTRRELEAQEGADDPQSPPVGSDHPDPPQDPPRS